MFVSIEDLFSLNIEINSVQSIECSPPLSANQINLRETKRDQPDKIIQ